MHDRARAGTRRVTILTLTVVLTALLLACLAPAAFAAGSYNGGADDYPLFIANDYTVSAIHFSAVANADTGTPSGLSPNTAYYVKVRFAVGPGPSGTTNRGWTWNPTTGQWAQERDDWTAFPQVTTDAAGEINGSAGWVYAAFGDTTKTGTYYVLVSLSTGGAGETLNGTLGAPVTVMDMTTSGAWAHNGVATGIAAAKRAEADEYPVADPPVVLALQKTEPNGVDDDGNGVVDDEDYGPPGNTGDFRMAVPLAQAFTIALGSGTPWAPAEDVTLSAPDVDIALGAVDQTPPSAPTGLIARARQDGTIALSWTAATDDVTSSPVYDVYRWTDAQPIGGAIQFTPRPQLVGTTTATSWTDDTGLVAKTTYYYLVRAVDEATNVGPRSNEAQATLGTTALALSASPKPLAYGHSVTLAGSLAAGADGVPGVTVTIERSYDKATWVPLADTTTSDAGEFSTTDTPKRSTWYRATFAGDGTFVASTSAPVKVGVRVSLSNPVAPKIAYRGRAFAVHGFLKPRHAPGRYTVSIKCYRKVSGHWKLVKTVRTTNRNYRGYTKYVASVRLPSKGAWRLRAYAPADKLYAATSSGYRYLTVR
jgi:hypothetical protein